MPRFIAIPALLLLFSLTIADDAKKPNSLFDLYKAGTLFDAKSYKLVRASASAAFQVKHDATIKDAFGTSHEELRSWLAKRPEIQDELFTALDETHDDIAAALKLFAELWKSSPTKVEEYPGLAIATSVVWDRPNPDLRGGKGGGVYDYTRHQVRTKSTMPENVVEAKGNFEYIANNPNTTVTSNVKGLPREFLAFVIDHRTPIEERQWAQKFVQKTKGISSWHQDIAYDHGMLKTEKTGMGPGPKLAGHEYSLQNIKKYGGVCAMQADFVARVGKSVGQPSVYVSGESSYRGWHAWVMWVAVTRPSKDKEKDSLKFTLVSDGRTRGFEKDAFYVGNLNDPQTGVKMLDRDMERRFNLVAQGARLRRQTLLAMRVMPEVVEKENLDAKGKMAFLEKVWAMSPQSEEAWMEFARLAKDGEVGKDVINAKLGVLLKTFAKYPDFIARLSKMLTPTQSPAAQAKHLPQEIALYEKAMRPDLACDAQLALAEVLKEQKKFKEAAAGLRNAAKKFPTEGRYIPKLMKAAEELTNDDTATVKPLADLYLVLIPALHKYYEGEANKPLTDLVTQCMNFYESKSLKTHITKLKAVVKIREVPQ
jgi:hypothetical protein